MSVVEYLAAFDVLISGALVVLSGLTLRNHLALSRMKTERIELENRLGTIQQQTCFDALTGLRTQRMFEARVSTLLRGREPFALIYIGLDGLKAVNDVRGHSAGDELIRLAVRAIRAAVRRRTDLEDLFRRGTAADEFFWVVERASTTLAVQLAEQVLMMLRSVSLSASIGVAEWDGQTIQTCEQIELAAEQQMQRAKRDGRGCVRSGTGLPSRGQTSEAVPLEVRAERAERNAA
jgi:diguanylate cyclase (GGDEF)-like protein